MNRNEKHILREMAATALVGRPVDTRLRSRSPTAEFLDGRQRILDADAARRAADLLDDDAGMVRAGASLRRYL